MKEDPSDSVFLKQALNLAKKGGGWTNPNPMVGALIVKDNLIIAKSYHKKYGSYHAEIEALKKTQGNTKGATLYVNLEPCCHYGKTPPCTEAIIKSGISKVVCSTLDPNPKVNGLGRAKLKKAGVKVIAGILNHEARVLNEGFFTFYQKQRPFIAIKFAASLDGKIATKTGDSKWITNEKARKFARKLRSQYQAVLVGVNTITKDNPHLGARMRGKKDPLRIILDPGLRIALESQVFRDNHVLVVTTLKHSKSKLAQLMHQGIEVLVLPAAHISIPALLSQLKERDIINILVEGGGKTIGSFIDDRLVDKVYAFFSPILVGGAEAITPSAGQGINKMDDAISLQRVSHREFEDNYLISGYTKNV